MKWRKSKQKKDAEKDDEKEDKKDKKDMEGKKNKENKKNKEDIARQKIYTPIACLQLLVPHRNQDCEWCFSFFFVNAIVCLFDLK